ncbi:MAG TPA: pyridoxamine 5'-phosphate oxidase family protein [Burkholderiaceae bacterium]|nr:pyridoxamine 5'-phosphate oxidase family protein [Burkholderiaceae bacterium]
MDQLTQEFLLNIIDTAKDLTLATVRPDGYPQATTVSYAHDGLTLYVGVGKASQKAENIRHNNKVSLTINTDYQDWNQIKGLSMGGLAEILADPGEIRHAADCMIRRFPQLAEWAESGQGSDAVFLKITPQVISILDYAKGFGHTDLVTL